MSSVPGKVILVVEHEDGTGPARMAEWIEERGPALELCRPWRGEDLPVSLDAYDGLLVLGGSMGPYEDERAPWLEGVRGLLRQAVARDLPTFAICLGAELLTVACGGKAGRAARPEVGLCELTPLQECAEDALFGPPAASGAALRAVQWHWEESAVLPDGAVPLLTSERCAHQAYRMGRRVWAVQFHPEVLAGDIAHWGREDAGPLRELGLDAGEIMREVEGEEGALRSVWGGVARRWADVVTGG
ncbi:type 1 glutamine amidotransferase [Streptomyces sp. ISL-98]|uniref:type 1 glutamine amidotransferase n=1 Tax=Streptomyces sp. ISL-98 TaxID=2819192 RepID=UPI001BEAA019|nr:type 1 glutamine amidotransferase [Streptomyces sp. ISL-98]MBT2509068.1 type 1 glutamine amidotransferase [Streptomyces sp. ISL-98]